MVSWEFLGRLVTGHLAHDHGIWAGQRLVMLIRFPPLDAL
jgi:hypothetical protein